MDLIQMMSTYVNNQIDRINVNELTNGYRQDHEDIRIRVQGRTNRNMDILEILIIYELENIQTVLFSDDQLTALYNAGTIPISVTNPGDFITQYRANQLASLFIMGDLHGLYPWLCIQIVTGDFNIMQRVHNLEIPIQALQCRYNYFSRNVLLRNEIRYLNQIRLNLPVQPIPLFTMATNIQQEQQEEEPGVQQIFADDNDENDDPDSQNGHNEE
jgi:hypothetical protein